MQCNYSILFSWCWGFLLDRVYRFVSYRYYFLILSNNTWYRASVIQFSEVLFIFHWIGFSAMMNRSQEPFSFSHSVLPLCLNEEYPTRRKNKHKMISQGVVLSISKCITVSANDRSTVAAERDRITVRRLFPSYLSIYQYRYIFPRLILYTLFRVFEFSVDGA